MAIPDYQTVMLPLLKFAADGQEHHVREAREALSEVFRLTDDERRALLPSGKIKVFESRVGWARTYLVKSGLLESPKRGYIRLTERGKRVLGEEPEVLNVKYLERYPECIAFKEAHKETVDEESTDEGDHQQTPQESLEEGYREIRNALAAELLEQIKGCSPEFFERLVVDLLLRMGYGGSRKDAGQAIGKTGDGGIDGIINEDRLGLDIVYIQAKRWENTVGRPELQKFAGALQGHRARKGVFITTSAFSSEAIEFVRRIDSKIALIDGQQLAELMIDHNLGVALANAYEIKRIDFDYFSEE